MQTVFAILESSAQKIAVRAGLKTEVTDQAAKHPTIALQFFGNNIEILLQSLTGGESLIV